MSDEFRQIANAMSDLRLGEPTLDGVLDALSDLHRLRCLYPPIAERERRAWNALEEIAHHANGPLGNVQNVAKLSDALANIAREGMRPATADAPEGR